MTGDAAPILQVEGLATHFHTRSGVVKAVNSVSFSLMPGKILGLVGESGSGKTVTGFSILGLVDPPGRIVDGKVLYRGNDLLTMPDAGLRHIRGNRIAMIFQDPMMTLNPVLRIDTQMIRAVLAHRQIPWKEARDIALEALRIVGIPAPEERLTSYPHELSGGMRQRVVIAIAMLHKPDIIIADEATTALDVTIQAQILSEVQNLCAATGTALVWITHDLSVVASLADDICVMYAGRIVEQGSVDQVLDNPQHPYTRGLIDSIPSANERGHKLRQIPGTTPSMIGLPPGCSFSTRCAYADAACQTDIPLVTDMTGQSVRCVHPAAFNQ